MVERCIKVKLTYEAVHYWPDCNILEVEYLKHPHRHLFYITACRKVSHGDREIEIIKFKQDIEQWLKVTWNNDLGCMSCEDLAKNIYDKFACSEVEVLEDNENGALVRDL